MKRMSLVRILLPSLVWTRKNKIKFTKLGHRLGQADVDFYECKAQEAQVESLITRSQAHSIISRPLPTKHHFSPSDPQ
jgi:hypothetical protein